MILCVVNNLFINRSFQTPQVQLSSDNCPVAYSTLPLRRKVGDHAGKVSVSCLEKKVDNIVD